LPGAPKPIVDSYANERWFLRFAFGFFDYPVDGGNIVPVSNFLHLPAISLETLFDIFRGQEIAAEPASVTLLSS
jgi:hypothetical protein